MNIKPLKWVRTSLRKIVANGQPLITETWIAKTAFATYKVYSSVSGRCFVVIPGATDGGLPGFYSDSLIGPPKTQCASVVEGQQIAEKHWLEAVTV